MTAAIVLLRFSSMCPRKSRRRESQGYCNCDTLLLSVGLLPDSWNLKDQSRYAVPINPGTVQENLAESLDRPYYSLRRLGNGALVHVPGTATPLTGSVPRCRLEGWPEAPFKVVITRLAQPTAVTFNDQPVEHAYDAAHRALVVTLPAHATGALTLAVTE